MSRSGATGGTPAQGPSASGVPALAAESEWIVERLPEAVLEVPHREADYYGASRLISRSLDLPFPPISRSSWLHGWLGSKPWEAAPDLDPQGVFGPRDPHRGNLVLTKAQVQFMERHGWSKVSACGAPFIYAPPSGVRRECGSLLVMPPHVTACTSQDWDEQAYVDQVTSLRDKFSKVVACVSGFCIARGYWTKAFEQVGIPWISGASTQDRNALLRMRVMFDSFEFVTTPKMGSHVAYAAYCGCKVSMYGVEMPNKREHFARDPMRQRYPEGLEVSLREGARERLMERYPFLFVDPAVAVSAVEWAKEELGEENRRTPLEMAALLGWYWREGEDETYLRHFLHSGTGRIARKLYALEVAVRKFLGRG
jgi:hypothetical protein